MPITKSAMKNLRQNRARNLRSRAAKTNLRTTIRKMRAAIEAENRSLAQSALPRAISVIDKAASKGIIPKNTARRYKSRAARRTNALLQSS